MWNLRHMSTTRCEALTRSVEFASSIDAHFCKSPCRLSLTSKSVRHCLACCCAVLGEGVVPVPQQPGAAPGGQRLRPAAHAQPHAGSEHRFRHQHIQARAKYAADRSPSILSPCGAFLSCGLRSGLPAQPCLLGPSMQQLALLTFRDQVQHKLRISNKGNHSIRMNSVQVTGADSAHSCCSSWILSQRPAFPSKLNLAASDLLVSPSACSPNSHLIIQEVIPE